MADDDYLKQLEDDYDQPRRVRKFFVRKPPRMQQRGLLQPNLGGGASVSIALAGGQGSPVNAGPVNFTVTFSEAATGFTNADVVTSTSTVGGTLTATVTGTGPSYNVAIAGMTGNGSVTISIPAAAATTTAKGLPFPASNAATVVFDTARPSVTVAAAAGQADPAILPPITFTVTFSEAVTGFLASDVVITGTAGGTKAVSLNGYNAEVTGMTTGGTVIATVPVNAVTDLAGNLSTVSNSASVNWTPDTTRPTVTINQAGGSDPTTEDTIFFSVFFSEVVTGFGPATASPDISFAGSTVGGTLSANISAGTGDSYLVSVSGMADPSGLVVVSIPANVAQDAAGNLNFASTSTDNVVQWNVSTTFQAIDGGSTYYASNGFTYAATAGWDNPSFIPICLFLERMDTTANFNTWVDLGLNTATCWQSDTPILLHLRANPGQIWAIPQANELSLILAANGGVLGAETVGMHAADEPGTTAIAYQYLESTANTYQDNRFWQITFLHTSIDFGDVGGTDIPDVMASLRVTPNTTTRHLDLSTVDHYFCAGAHYSGIRSQVSPKFQYGAGWGRPDITEAQCRRPCHYGDYTRFIRNGMLPAFAADSWFREIGSFPTGVWIETNGPYTENTDPNFVMKPAELNAAVWSTIINGARIIQYFSLGEGSVGDSLINGTFWQTPLPGETVSNYDQIKATNAFVKSLATVINSPFALNFVTVSPAAQVLNGAASVDDAGFDVMAKLHNVSGGDNKYYIFAMPRVAATPSQTATFTIDPGAMPSATYVTVINESRTIAITGGTTFTDTFATGNTVHIYRIETGAIPTSSIQTYFFISGQY